MEKRGEKWAEDIMKTTGKATKISLEANRKEITSNEDDLAFITVNIVDKNNLLVPKSNNMVIFKIDGPGEIVAVGNGDPTCHEPFSANKHSAFNGKCLVIIRSKTKTGTIKLTATAKGLKKDIIEIQVRN